MIPKTAKLFAVFDARNGYWQIELSEESRPLTTFLTEWGTFWYKRLPMGLICSGDEYCSRTDRALTGLEGVLKLIDDILIYADDIQQLKKRIKQLFKRCLESKITLGKKKFQAG